MTDHNPTRKIIELLRIRHDHSSWACFAEMPYSSGTGSTGRLDFFAFNVWPSEKFRRVAYEIKVSRSDFNNELNNPAKRAPAEKVANECFFVMPVGIAKVDEIPEGWGLIELFGGKGGLKKKKNAKWHEVDDPNLGFICSMVRRKADNRPELPAAFWKLEGREVDEGGLEEYIKSQVAYHRVDWRLEMEAKHAKDKDKRVDELERLESIIRSYIGWHYTDPDEFLEWCKKYSHKQADQEIKGAFATLKRTRDRLTSVLDEEERRRDGK